MRQIQELLLETDNINSSRRATVQRGVGLFPLVPRWFAALGIVLSLGVASPLRGAEPALEFGLPPYISTRTLLSLFKPMSAYIERRLGREIMLVTAPRLEDFDDRLIAQDYDIAIVSPHTARLAQREYAYQPLLRFTEELYGVFLVKAESPIQSVRELNGHVIAFPQRTSATALLGKEVLERLGVGMKYVEYPHAFQDSVLLGLIQGEYPAALVNYFVFRRASAEHKAELRQIGETRKTAHIMLVARASLPLADRENLRIAVTEFIEKTREGTKFLQETGLGGVRPPSDADLRSLDSLAAEQKKIWEELRLGHREER